MLDFEVLEREVVDFKCKLFIFCNLMNLVGLVFIKVELDCIVEICNVNNVKLCFDEIYCDFILEEGK